MRASRWITKEAEETANADSRTRPVVLQGAGKLPRPFFTSCRSTSTLHVPLATSSLRASAVALAGVVLVAATTASSSVAGAQALPLRKSEIVRLLTGATYSQAEIASIVARSCLAFRPTSRDRTDFRALGATAAVLAAVERCERPAVAPAPLPALRIEAADVLEASAGDSVTVSVRTVRGGTAEAGVKLVLVEQTLVGTRTLLETVTDAAGSAALRIEAGRVAGARQLMLRRDDQQENGHAIVLDVRPAPPAVALTAPAAIALRGAPDSATTLLIMPRDRFGNALAVLELVVERRRGALTDTIVRSPTGESGLLRIDVWLPELQRGDDLRVLSEGAELVLVPVVAERPRVHGASALTVRAVQMMDDAEQHMIEGRAGAALALYGQVLDLHPDVGEALLGKGQALAALGRSSEAETPLLELLAADPTNAAALTQLGWVYLDGGLLARAEELFLMAMNAAKGQSVAARGYATAALRAGRYERAVRLFEDALTLFPADAELLVGLGDALAEIGRSADARTRYEQALTIEPLLESARTGLARVR